MNKTINAGENDKKIMGENKKMIQSTLDSQQQRTLWYTLNKYFLEEHITQLI